MRAVNLIPAEARTGGGAGAAGRSGGAVYVVLGGLTVLVALVGMWAMTGHKLASDRAELAQLKSDAAAAQRQSSDLASFGQFRALREQRTETVKTLAAARVDWASTLDAIARTLPAGAWLDSLTAGATPTSAPAGGTGGAGAIASSSTGPSVQIGGCIGSQARVARLMPRLRAIPHVERVSLVSSQAADTSGPSGASSSECRQVSFQMVLFFTGGPPAATTATPGAPATAATPAPVPASTQGTTQ